VGKIAHECLIQVIEKCPKDDLTIFLVGLKNHQTTIRELGEEEKENIIQGEIDPFFQYF